MSNIWNKTKEAAHYVVETIGLKKPTPLDSIYEKRALIRKFRQEFGRNAADLIGDKENYMAKQMFEDLQKQTNQLNEEIHNLEKKMINQYDPLLGLTKMMYRTIPVSTELEGKIFCRKCSSLITYETVQCFSPPVEDLEFFYHRDCFHCSHCSNVFTNYEFYKFEGALYCEYCTSKIAQLVLHWCQQVLTDFDLIEIKDYTSFHNGLAFAALLTHYRPDLMDLKSLPLNHSSKLLKKVFTSTHRANIPVILTPEYMREADNQSIFTQVSLFYLFFHSQHPSLEGKNKWNTFISHYFKEDKFKQDLSESDGRRNSISSIGRRRSGLTDKEDQNIYQLMIPPVEIADL